MQYEFALTPVHKRPISMDAFQLYCTTDDKEHVLDICERLDWTLRRACDAIQELALAGLVIAVYTRKSGRPTYRRTAKPKA